MLPTSKFHSCTNLNADRSRVNCIGLETLMRFFTRPAQGEYISRMLKPSDYRFSKDAVKHLPSFFAYTMLSAEDAIFWDRGRGGGGGGKTVLPNE